MNISVGCSVRFGSDNAAFQGGNARAETVRILRHIANLIESEQEGSKVLDANGNSIGDWWYDEEDVDE